jgi:2-polyprenyl-6-methoxyphenol hydroxylase-like FAD-dependent oxidoreductase
MLAERSTAVVLGGSIAGLLAARVLANHFSQVFIVERDRLAVEPEPRRGVPQAAHAHGLLSSGYQVMDRYFPGMMDELEAIGAPRGDVAGDFLWFLHCQWKLRHDVGMPGIIVSRPRLEAAVRQRIRSIPNVSILDGTIGVMPAFDRGGARVTGMHVRDVDSGSEKLLNADLVVDASGRGSHAVKWLAESGYGEPESISIRVDIEYGTRLYKRKSGDLFNSNGVIIAGMPPNDRRTAGVLAIENNTWMVSLAGRLGDNPGQDVASWEAFAAGLAVPVVHDLISSACPLSDVTTYKFAATKRLFPERMARFPEGFILIGDALCHFNPIYGQGMSVAAMEASMLDETLAENENAASKRFHERAGRIVDIPWMITTGEDFRFPQVEGKRPWGSSLINKYLDRVHAAASKDPDICRRFFTVLNLLEPPPSLMLPSVVWRVMSRRLPREPGSPWGTIAASRRNHNDDKV